MASTSLRWDALDVFRGLTIMLMLLNLSPGSWEYNYGFLVHARWDGGTLIDMVAPAFLFCIGVAMPLSFERRASKGARPRALLVHVFWRSLMLVAIGFFLNLYPKFDFDTVRIPGVLQRIGLCYGLAGFFMIVTASRRPDFKLRSRPIAIAALLVLVSYWALLYFVPAPGYTTPSFGPVDSWPAVIDRTVIGTEHFFPYWPVDGKVVFDPEGILSTWPSCFNVLFGALVGIAFARRRFGFPAITALVVGGVMMGVALALQGLCPIIKNLWTSSFALFSSGFSVAVLGLLMGVSQAPGVRPLFAPARIFGENPLLAYILCFLMAPLIDAEIAGGAQPVSLRAAGQAWVSRFLEARAASLAFGLCGLAVIFIVLLVCHRKRWILKL
jgi:predicted acyltransferase